jgi:cytochrome P450
MSSQAAYDLYSQDYAHHAYERFKEMRKERPVLQQPGLDGETQIWFLSRFEDIVAMLKDDQHFVLDYHLAIDQDQIRRFQAGRPDVMEMVNNHLLTKEGEDHRRLRALVSQAFTPRRISDMRPRIQEIARELLDKVTGQGQMDLVESYAFPLPIIVIAELLGIPAEDRNQFRAWSDIFVKPAISKEDQNRFVQMSMQFVAYLQTLFTDRRKNPRNDLISALLQAEEAGDKLSTPELFSMIVLLIIAGHETTVTLIGNASVALMTHPDSMSRLKQHPEEMPHAVEEFLRFDAPVNRTVTRIVAQDIQLAGYHFRRGELVIGLLGSANHDETHFKDADMLSIERGDRSHLAFGYGVHYCLGSPLARLEAEIALNTLLRRLPNLRLAVPAEKLEYREVPLFHAYAHIPVEF